MISDWRRRFNGGTTPIKGRPRSFVFVQLPPYSVDAGERGGTSTALIREAQLAALRLPHVGMASAVDYGDPRSPVGNIHPRWKAPVGNRLALTARALTYGSGVAFKGPAPLRATNGVDIVEVTVVDVGPSMVNTKTVHIAGVQSCSNVPANKQENNWHNKFWVNVDKNRGWVTVTRTDWQYGWFQKLQLHCNATLEHSVVLTFDSPVHITAPLLGPCPVSTVWCAWMAVDGHNASVHPTSDPRTLLLSARGMGTHPQEVRYLFGDWPVPFLYDASGSLPVTPFRIPVNTSQGGGHAGPGGASVH